MPETTRNMEHGRFEGEVLTKLAANARDLDGLFERMRKVEELVTEAKVRAAFAVKLAFALMGFTGLSGLAGLAWFFLK